MQGLYIHIPFCAQACHYCDFHFSTSSKLKREMIDMICKELEIRKDFFDRKKLDTVYFGGGTPSLLDKNELALILNTISKYFLLDKDSEITLEANPDDLKIEKLKDLKALGINRLSIGIQSFNEKHLKFLNRIHQSEEAVSCVINAQKIGFENITIDLIYGIHSENHDIWKKDLNTSLSLEVPHISSYCLTIENGTTFGNWVKKKIIPEIDEEFAAEQFEILIQRLENAGMEQYEISNFSIPGRNSRHNSNYWLGGTYLGVGPSAHSYNKHTRQFNISNNSLYIKSLKEDKIPGETESLSPIDKFNESLLTGIRTKWGFDLKKFEMEKNVPASFPYKKVKEFEDSGLIILNNGIVTLTRKGKLLADKITVDLFA